ncbi:MAG: hypothetical protein VR69_12540 [Peptococcaceae bacterium BRH_c4b]|nr:MAG: hypothetical protein VR69_12540 [Peptococcaceae bacterium BRH_c4b]
MFLAIVYSMVILRIVSNGANLSIIILTKKYSPVLGSILGFILVIYFILIGFVYLRDFVDFMNLYFPKTPTVILSLILSFLGAYAIKQGLEVIARLAAILILPVLLLVVVGFIGNSFNFDYHPILIPIENWKDTIKGVIFSFTTYGELLVLTMLHPLTKSSENTAKFIIMPIIFAGLLIAVLTYTLYGNFSNLYHTYRL